MDTFMESAVRHLSIELTSKTAPVESHITYTATSDQHDDQDCMAPAGEPVDAETTFPEGGRDAWLVVAGACLCLYPSMGLMVSIGPVQDYLNQNQLRGYSSSEVGWIPSVFVYLSLALGIWVGPLFDRYGPRWILLSGSVGYAAMIFLLAECKAYYQFVLCLGVLGGTTAALLVTSSLGCVAHWFKRRRGLSQGIAMIGSSFGGLTIPLVLRETFPRYGYAWSIRILGFVFVACLLLGNMILKARIQPSRSNRIRIISLSVFRDPRFTLLTTSVFCFEVVLFGSLGIVPTYATISTTYPADTGFYLVAVMNGVSSVGRLVTGYISDKFGRFNTLFVSSIVALLAMLVVWLPFGQHHLGALYTFIVIFGACTGCWMALVPSCIGQLCRAEEFGRYYGSCYFFASLALLVCIPISGQLVEQVGAQAMVGFYCAVLAAGCVMFVASRQVCVVRAKRSGEADRTRLRVVRI